MRTKRTIGALVVLSLILACTPPPSIVTEPGKQAYQANQIVLRVNELMNTVIALETSKVIPTNIAIIVVRFCVKADETLDKLPEGWGVTVRTAYIVLKTDSLLIPYLTNPKISIVISALDLLLGA